MVQECMATSLLRNARMEVDTSALDQEIENYKIQLRKVYEDRYKEKALIMTRRKNEQKR